MRHRQQHHLVIDLSVSFPLTVTDGGLCYFYYCAMANITVSERQARLYRQARMPSNKLEHMPCYVQQNNRALYGKPRVRGKEKILDHATPIASASSSAPVLYYLSCRHRRCFWCRRPVLFVLFFTCEVLLPLRDHWLRSLGGMVGAVIVPTSSFCLLLDGVLSYAFTTVLSKLFL